MKKFFLGVIVLAVAVGVTTIDASSSSSYYFNYESTQSAPGGKLLALQTVDPLLNADDHIEYMMAGVVRAGSGLGAIDVEINGVNIFHIDVYPGAVVDKDFVITGTVVSDGEGYLYTASKITSGFSNKSSNVTRIPYQLNKRPKLKVAAISENEGGIAKHLFKVEQIDL